MMTMKSQHMFQALNDLAASAPSSTAVVCCQNGVGNEYTASRFFQHVYGMLVMLPATISSRSCPAPRRRRSWRIPGCLLLPYRHR